MTCYRCGRDDHFARECYQQRSNSTAKNSSGCFKCGQPGHFARECPGKNNINSNSQVKCHDCHSFVSNLKLHQPKAGSLREHRRECPNSRYTHSKIVVEPSDSNTTAQFNDTTDYYAILDVSSSMVFGRLDRAKQVLTDLVPQMQENDRISIVTFDTQAFFKLKPRPVGQIIRQNELPDLLNRIFARGLTAIWDAIYLAVSQIQDKSRRTIMIVLTDGEDNSSRHSYQEVLDLVNTYPSISLDIVHIGGKSCPQYVEICENRGTYSLINDTTLTITFSNMFTNKMEVNVTTSTQISESPDSDLSGPQSLDITHSRIRKLPTKVNDFYNCRVCNRKYKRESKYIKHMDEKHRLQVVC